MSKRKSATPKMTLIVLLTISAVLLLLLGIWLVGELKDAFRDPPAVTTPSPDVSTPFAGSSEVEMLIESYVKDMRKDQTMTVSAGGASVKLSLNEANAPFDYDELTAYMKSKGYELSLIKQYQSIQSVKSNPSWIINDEYIIKKIDELAASIDKGSDTEYELTETGVTFRRGTEHTTVDKDAALKTVREALATQQDAVQLNVITQAPELPDLEELYAIVHCEPADAYYDVDADKNTIVVKEVIGYDIDIDEIRKELETGTWTEKTFAKREIRPEVTTETLPNKYFKDLLGKGVSNYNPAEKNRTVNVGLATAAINESIVLPGQTFSFNRVVGERTADKGYKPATVFQNGGMQEGLGGGICQVSSTLYVASLYAEMDQISRYVHAYKVSYVDLGMDATLYYGSLDYVFRNNTDEPIKIVAKANGGTLTVSIYGKETRPANRKIKFKSVVLETYEQVMKYEEDPTMAPGTEKKIRNGMPGYKVELYKQIYVDGVLQKEVKVNTSKYSAYNGLTKVGPKPVETDPPVTDPVTEPPVTEPPAPTEPPIETDDPNAPGI